MSPITSITGYWVRAANGPPAAPARRVMNSSRLCAYLGGRRKHWIKVKNRAHPAYSKVRHLLLATRPKFGSVAR